MRGTLVLVAMTVAVCHWAGIEGRSQDGTVLHDNLLDGRLPPMEHVRLRDGRICSGLVESVDDLWIHFIEVRRTPGKPTGLVIWPIERSRVVEVRRLDSEQARVLRGRIDQFRNRLEIEAARMKAVRLDSVRRDDRLHHDYQGHWFSLDSTVDEATTRWIAVRAEQLFAAYRQILPPRAERAEPVERLRIVVTGSLQQYRAHLEGLGVSVDNPAVYLPEHQQVVLGSELSRLAAELGKITAHHEQLLDDMDQLEETYRVHARQVKEVMRRQGASRLQIERVLRNASAQRASEINRAELQIERAERENARVRRQADARVLRQLYHEAFHAYLAHHVFPDHQGRIPPWLDEGLATMFERSLLDSGVLRLDAPNEAALERLRADLKSDAPLPLAEVLAADRRRFIVSQQRPTDQADRYYAHAWGLVYYLTFQKGLLATTVVDRYLADARADPVVRFERMVGMPLATFDRSWREFIDDL